MITKLKIADYITLSNLVLGLIAIYLSFNNQIIYSAILILIGVILDKLDGYTARRLNQVSDLGAQLDSFADIITFGVAPLALIVNHYNVLFISLIALFIPLAGALRLSRFNITKIVHFEGVPITVNGIIFPVLILLNVNNYVICTFIILQSFLMISKIRIKKVL